MTIEEYIDNPMGKGDSALGANRLAIKGILTEKYQRLTTKKRIKTYCYNGTKKGQITIHLVIPSETERDNTYDVVFEFTPKDKSMQDAKTLKDYDVRVFANSPSFAYTFAYVYKKHDLLINSLVKKLGKSFVKIAPDVRNRYQIVSYEKYIFFGAMYITESGLLTKKTLEEKLTSMNPLVFPAKVRTLEQIMSEYSTEEAKIRKKKRKDNVAQKKIDAEKKKEMTHIKSGVHQVGHIQKNMGHPTSAKKSNKSIRNISGKKPK